MPRESNLTQKHHVGKRDHGSAQRQQGRIRRYRPLASLRLPSTSVLRCPPPEMSISAPVM